MGHELWSAWKRHMPGGLCEAIPAPTRDSGFSPSACVITAGAWIMVALKCVVGGGYRVPAAKLCSSGQAPVSSTSLLTAALPCRAIPCSRLPRLRHHRRHSHRSRLSSSFHARPLNFPHCSTTPLLRHSALIHRWRPCAQRAASRTFQTTRGSQCASRRARPFHTSYCTSQGNMLIASHL